ncbi:MAG: hypothetical protein RLZZ127_1736 [Planctomycetota bacterium]|jgi:hypothetical protein
MAATIPPGALLRPESPAAAPAAVAAAHARLAALGLPTTGPWLALAERAAAQPATAALVPDAPPAGSPLPPRDSLDLARDPTVALRLAGVRVEGSSPEPSLPAVALAAATADPAALPAAREAVAEAVLPGQDMADYDRVIPIPLVVDGQPTPARLAVGGREARPGQGRAAWVRLDADLAALGPVSIRLSDSGGGPLAITIAARGDGALALADGLPDLIADLDRLGLAAAVRIVEEVRDG